MRLVLMLSLLAGCAARAQIPAAAEDIFAEQVRPFFEQWCIACHGSRRAKARLDLEKLEPAARDAAARGRLRKIRDRLRAGEMPPAGRRPPPPAEVEAVLAWLDRTMAAPGAGAADPGRVTMRRLSRVEYRNAIRDLLGIGEDVTRGFPADDLGYGFDNIGGALSISPLHLEKYAAAAERIAALAIVNEDPENLPERRFEAEVAKTGGRGISQSGGFANFFSSGRLSQSLTLPRDGEYILRIRAWGDQAGPEAARMALSVDGKRLVVLDVPETRKAPGIHERLLRLPEGQHTLAIDFANDYYKPDHPDPKQRDRNLKVDWFAVIGPVDPPLLPWGHRWLFALDPKSGPPAERARSMIEALLLRAWRRPPSAGAVKRYAELVAEAVRRGDSFTGAVRIALQGALTSPHFLFRAEPGDTGGPAGQVRALDPYALASRLAFFLWSSLPDERLLGLAGTAELAKPEVLEAEVRRMLADPRASALATNFAVQWLELRSLGDAAPDPERFPEFDDVLRTDMLRESVLLFEAVLRERRDVRELLSADFSFMSGRLAAHYGIEGVAGPHFQRVRLLDDRRGGLLGHAGIQLITSHATRTSPVKRGKWILENVLGTPPPPPPAGVDNLAGEAGIDSAATLREQMELHRRDPVCASCHQRLDPLGFALENYDAVGRWRDRDGGGVIDASGKLPDGRRIEGPIQLRALLCDDDRFLTCLARKLFIFGVGRDVEPADEELLVAWVAEHAPETVTLEDLILSVVRMDAFQQRETVER